MIAVRQREEEAPQADQPFQQARHEAFVVEREAERGGGWRAASRRHPLDEALRLFLPAGLEHRVGMQEEEPIAACGARAGLELSASPPLRTAMRRVPAASAMAAVSSVEPPSTMIASCTTPSTTAGTSAASVVPKRRLGVEGGDNH